MSDRSRQRLRTITIVLATALVIAPAAALAGHQFTDVPPSNIFQADIDWMADNGVTKGCNPPDNTEYCPDDNVTGGQMAAFMHRLETENVFVRPGEDAVDGGDADTVDGKDSTEFGGRLFAVVAGGGTLVRGNGATSAAKTSTTIDGNYEVIFDRDVTGCAYMATIGAQGSSVESPGSITVASRFGNPNGVFVDTEDLSSADADRSFHLFVIC